MAYLGPHPSDEIEEQHTDVHNDRTHAAEMLLLMANGDPHHCLCFHFWVGGARAGVCLSLSLLWLLVLILLLLFT
jgi:hypothetical protein